MWGEETDAVTSIHTLNHVELNRQLNITGLSWNSTGSVIAAAYPFKNHYIC